MVYAIILFVVITTPSPIHAAPLSDLFTAPDSLIVKIQEKVEYFFAFSDQQKIAVLDKQAERRLAHAKSLVKTADVAKIPALLKEYETLKHKQSELIKVAPATTLVNAEEETVKQQASIEDLKENLPEPMKQVVSESQITVIESMVDSIEEKETNSEVAVTNFIKEIKEVINPTSVEVLESAREIAPGAFAVTPGTQEVAPGSSQTSPGSLETAP